MTNEQHIENLKKLKSFHNGSLSADGNNGHPVFKLQDSLDERVAYETTVHNEFTTSRIIAWMPLPEPYKAEGSEEE